MAVPWWGTEQALRVLWTTLWLAVLLVLVWRRRALAWLVGTAGLVLPIWVWAVWLGERLPVSLEWLTLPVALAAACSAALGARAFGAPMRVWALRTGGWALLLPSLVLAVTVLVPQSTTEAFRLLGVVAGLGLIAVIADRRAPVDSLVAATLLVGVALLLVWRLAAEANLPVEGYAVPLAVAVALVGGWIIRPADPGRWWRWARWPALAALGVSSAWAVTGGLLPGAAWYDSVRVAVLIVVWVVAAQRSVSKSPWAAAAFGSTAVVIAAANGISLLLAGRSDPPVELFTWPLAAALGTISWLVWRAVDRRGPSLLWVGPAAALVLLPTAAQAWAGGSAGWRAWFGLLLGAVVLVLGVRWSWAGLVVPGLLSIAFVVLPVLLQLAGDAPVWVPLTIGGVGLIAIGARLEATRRQGRRVIDWAVHLH
jgi:hypothetical protein